MGMKLSRMLVLPALVGIAALLPTPAVADPGQDGPITTNPPEVFAPDHDDPRIADPNVVVPKNVKPCSVTVVEHEFKDWSVHDFDFAAPTDCGPWSQVVLRLDGSVDGVQYDRLGWIDINGVRAMTLSTPEPSLSGISWHVEKDITDLIPLLEADGNTMSMYIGNTVNETYTGIFDVTVTLDFYPTGGGQGPAEVADHVIPLSETYRDHGDLVGSLTVPRSTERLRAQIYATGSGGGCEEFWDLSVPAETGYWCGNGLPYREVQVIIDGQLAGIAMPFAYVYTGGWSNPILWYNIPSPGAFNILPLEYDLTPFLGLLNDGETHEVRIHVDGMPDTGDGWTLSPLFHVETAKNGKPVQAELVSVEAPEAVIESEDHDSNAENGRVTMDASRTFKAVGWVQTQTGRVTTTVEREVSHVSDHYWSVDGDTERDGLTDTTWTDRSSVTTQEKNRKPSVSVTDATWTKDGFMQYVSLPTGALEVTTTLDITRSWDTLIRDFGKLVEDSSTVSDFEGTAI